MAQVFEIEIKLKNADSLKQVGQSVKEVEEGLKRIEVLSRSVSSGLRSLSKDVPQFRPVGANAPSSSAFARDSRAVSPGISNSSVAAIRKAVAEGVKEGTSTAFSEGVSSLKRTFDAQLNKQRSLSTTGSIQSKASTALNTSVSSAFRDGRVGIKSFSSETRNQGFNDLFSELQKLTQEAEKTTRQRIRVEEDITKRMSSILEDLRKAENSILTPDNRGGSARTAPAILTNLTTLQTKLRGRAGDEAIPITPRTVRTAGSKNLNTDAQRIARANEQSIADSISKLEGVFTSAVRKGRVDGRDVLSSKALDALNTKFKTLGASIDDIASSAEDGAKLLSRAALQEVTEKRKGTTVVKGLEFQLLNLEKLNKIAQERLPSDKIRPVIGANDAEVAKTLRALKSELKGDFNSVVKDAVVSFQVPALSATKQGLNVITSGQSGVTKRNAVTFVEFTSGVDRFVDAVTELKNNRPSSVAGKLPVQIKKGLLSGDLSDDDLKEIFDSLRQNSSKTSTVKTADINKALRGAIAGRLAREAAFEKVVKNVGSERAARVTRAGISSSDLTASQIREVQQVASNVKNNLVELNADYDELFNLAQKVGVKNRDIISQLAVASERNIIDQITTNLTRKTSDKTFAGGVEATELGRSLINLVGFNDRAPDFGKASSTFSKQVNSALESLETLDTQVRLDKKGGTPTRASTNRNLLPQVQVRTNIPNVDRSGKKVPDTLFRATNAIITELNDEVRRASEEAVFSAREDLKPLIGLSGRSLSEELASNVSVDKDTGKATLKLARGDTRSIIPFGRTAVSLRRSDQPLSGSGPDLPLLRTKELQQGIDEGVIEPYVFNVVREFKKTPSTFEDQILIRANSDLAKSVTGNVRTLVRDIGEKFTDKSGNIISRDEALNEVFKTGDVITKKLGLPALTADSKDAQVRILEIVEDTIRQGSSVTDAQVVKILEEFSPNRSGRKVILPGGTKGVVKFVDDLGIQQTPRTPVERLQALGKFDSSTKSQKLKKDLEQLGNIALFDEATIRDLELSLPKSNTDQLVKKVESAQKRIGELLGEDSFDVFGGRKDDEAFSAFFGRKTKDVAFKERNIDLRLSGADVARRGLRTDVLEGVANQLFGEVPVVLGKESPERLRQAIKDLGGDIGFTEGEASKLPLLTKVRGGSERPAGEELSFVTVGAVSEIARLRPQAGLAGDKTLKIDPNTRAALDISFATGEKRPGSDLTPFVEDIEKIGKKSSVRVLELSRVLATLDQEVAKANPQFNDLAESIRNTAETIDISKIKTLNKSFASVEELSGTIFDPQTGFSKTSKIKISDEIRNALPDIPESIIIPSFAARGTFSSETGLVGIDQIGRGIDRLITRLQEAETTTNSPLAALSTGTRGFIAGLKKLEDEGLLDVNTPEGKERAELVSKEIDRVVSNLRNVVLDGKKAPVIDAEAAATVTSSDSTIEKILNLEQLLLTGFRDSSSTGVTERAPLLSRIGLEKPRGESGISGVDVIRASLSGSLQTLSGEFGEGFNISFEPGKAIDPADARAVKLAVDSLVKDIKQQVFGKDGIIDREIADIEVPNIRLVTTSSPVNIGPQLKNIENLIGKEEGDLVSRLTEISKTAQDIRNTAAQTIVIHEDRLKELLESLAKAGNIDRKQIPSLLKQAGNPGKDGGIFGATGRFPITDFKSLQSVRISTTKKDSEKFTVSLPGIISDEVKDSFSSLLGEDGASGKLIDERKELVKARDAILSKRGSSISTFDEQELQRINKNIVALDTAIASLINTFNAITQNLDNDGDKIHIFTSGTIESQKQLADSTRSLTIGFNESGDVTSDFRSILQRIQTVQGGSKIRSNDGAAAVDNLVSDPFSELDANFRDNEGGFFSKFAKDAAAETGNKELIELAGTLRTGVFSTLNSPEAIGRIADFFKKFIEVNNDDERALRNKLSEIGVVLDSAPLIDGGIDSENTAFNIDRAARDAVEQFDIKNAVTRLVGPKALTGPVTETVNTFVRLIEADFNKSLKVAMDGLDIEHSDAIKKEIEDRIAGFQSIAGNVINEGLSTKHGNIPQAIGFLEALDAPLLKQNTERGQQSFQEFLSEISANPDSFKAVSKPAAQVATARRESLSLLSRDELEKRAIAFAKINESQGETGIRTAGKIYSAEQLSANIGNISSTDLIDSLSSTFSTLESILKIRDTLEKFTKISLGEQFQEREQRILREGDTPSGARFAVLRDIASTFGFLTNLNPDVDKLRKAVGGDIGNPEFSIQDIVNKAVDIKGPRTFEARGVSKFRKFRQKDFLGLESGNVFGSSTGKEKQQGRFVRTGGVTGSFLSALADAAGSPEFVTTETKVVADFLNTTEDSFSNLKNRIQAISSQFEEGNIDEQLDVEINKAFKDLGLNAVGVEELSRDTLLKRAALFEQIANDDRILEVDKDKITKALSIPLEDLFTTNLDNVFSGLAPAEETLSSLDDLKSAINADPLKDFVRSIQNVQLFEGPIETLDDIVKSLDLAEAAIEGIGLEDQAVVDDIKNRLRSLKVDRLKAIVPTLEGGIDFVEKLSVADSFAKAAKKSPLESGSSVAKDFASIDFADISGPRRGGGSGGGGGFGGGSNDLLERNLQVLNSLQEQNQKLLEGILELLKIVIQTGGGAGTGEVVRSVDSFTQAVKSATPTVQDFGQTTSASVKLLSENLGDDITQKLKDAGISDLKEFVHFVNSLNPDASFNISPSRLNAVRANSDFPITSLRGFIENSGETPTLAGAPLKPELIKALKQLDSEQTAVGTAVDEALEVFQKEFSKRRDVGSFEEASDKARAKLQESLQQSGFDQNPQARDFASRTLEAFLGNPDKTQRNVVGTQLALFDNVDGQRIGGVLDTLVELPDGNLGILDFKTSATVPDFTEVASNLQLLTYSYILEKIAKDEDKAKEFIEKNVSKGKVLDRGALEDAFKKIRKGESRIIAGIDPVDLPVSSFAPNERDFDYLLNEIELGRKRILQQRGELIAKAKTDPVSAFGLTNLVEQQKQLEKIQKSGNAFANRQVGDVGKFGKNDIAARAIFVGQPAINKGVARGLFESISSGTAANFGTDFDSSRQRILDSLLDIFAKEANKNPSNAFTIGNFDEDVKGTIEAGRVKLNKNAFPQLSRRAESGTLTVEDLKRDAESHRIISTLVHEAAHKGLQDAFNDNYDPSTFGSRQLDSIIAGNDDDLKTLLFRSSATTLESGAADGRLEQLFGGSVPGGLNDLVLQDILSVLGAAEAPDLGDEDIQAKLRAASLDVLNKSLEEILATLYTKEIIPDATNLARLSLPGGKDIPTLTQRNLRKILTSSLSAPSRTGIGSLSIEDDQLDDEYFAQKVRELQQKSAAGTLDAAEVKRVSDQYERRKEAIRRADLAREEFGTEDLEDLFGTPKRAARNFIDPAVKSSNLIPIPTEAGKIPEFIDVLNEATASARGRIFGDTARNFPGRQRPIFTPEEPDFNSKVFKVFSGDENILDEALKEAVLKRATRANDLIRALRTGSGDISTKEARQQLNDLFKEVANSVGTKDLAKLNTELNLAVTEGIVAKMQSARQQFESVLTDPEASTSSKAEAARSFEQTFAFLNEQLQNEIKRPIVGKRATSPFILNPFSQSREIIPEIRNIQGLGDRIPAEALRGALSQLQPEVYEAIKQALGEGLPSDVRAPDRIAEATRTLLGAPDVERAIINTVSSLEQTALFGDLFSDAFSQREFQRVVKAMKDLANAFDQASSDVITLSNDSLTGLKLSIEKRRKEFESRNGPGSFNLGKELFGDPDRVVDITSEFKEIGPIIKIPKSAPENIQQALSARNLEEIRKQEALRNLAPDIARREGLIEREGKFRVRQPIRTAAGRDVRIIDRKFIPDNRAALGFRERIDDINGALGEDRQTLALAFKRVALWGTASGITYSVVRAFQDMVSVIQETEVNMVELRKVMNPATTDFDQLRNSAVDFAKEFGTSVNNVLESFVVFAKQGLDQAAVLDRGRVATLAANVSVLKAAEATEILTSALKQFPTEGGSAITFLDSMNEVANRFAVTEKDLGHSLLRAGAAAKVAGLSFDEFLGITTSLVEVTRKSGKEVGTSIRFLLRSLFRPKSRDALGDIGIATTDVTGLRPAGDILKELANRFDSLTSAQKLNTLQAVAGTRRYNDLAVILTNYDTALRATEISATSQGSALKENEIVMQSLAKRIEVLKASTQSLTLQFGDLFIRAVKPVIFTLTQFTQALELIPTPVKAATLALGGLFILADKIDSLKRKSEDVLQIARIGDVFSGIGGSISRGALKAFELVPGRVGSVTTAIIGLGVAFSEFGPQIIQGLEKIGVSFLGFGDIGTFVTKGLTERLAVQREAITNLTNISSKLSSANNSRLRAQSLESLTPEEQGLRIQEGTFVSPVLLRVDAEKESLQVVNQLALANSNLVDFYTQGGNAVLTNNELLSRQVDLLKDVALEATALTKLDFANTLSKQLLGETDKIKKVIRDVVSLIPFVGDTLSNLDIFELQPINRIEEILPELNSLLARQKGGDFTVGAQITDLQKKLESAKVELAGQIGELQRELSSISDFEPERILGALSPENVRAIELQARLELDREGVFTSQDNVDTRTGQRIASLAFGQFGVPQGRFSGREIGEAFKEGGVSPSTDDALKSVAERTVVVFSREIADNLGLAAEFAVATKDGLQSVSKDNRLATVTASALDTAIDQAGDKFISVFSRGIDNIAIILEETVRDLQSIPVGVGFGTPFTGGIETGAANFRELDEQVRLFRLFESNPILNSSGAERNVLDFIKKQQSAFNKGVEELDLKDLSEATGEVGTVAVETVADLIKLKESLAINTAFVELNLQLLRLGDALFDVSDKFNRSILELETSRQFLQTNLLTGGRARNFGDIGTRSVNQSFVDRLSETFRPAGQLGDNLEFLQRLQDASVEFIDTTRGARLDFETSVRDFIESGLFDTGDVEKVLKTVNSGGDLNQFANIKLSERGLELQQQQIQEAQKTNELLREQLGIGETAILNSVSDAINTFDPDLIASALRQANEFDKKNRVEFGPGSLTNRVAQLINDRFGERLQQTSITSDQALEAIRSRVDSEVGGVRRRIEDRAEAQGISFDEARRQEARVNPRGEDILKASERFQAIEDELTGFNRSDDFRRIISNSVATLAAVTAVASEGRSITEDRESGQTANRFVQSLLDEFNSGEEAALQQARQRVQSFINQGLDVASEGRAGDATQEFTKLGGFFGPLRREFLALRGAIASQAGRPITLETPGRILDVRSQLKDTFGSLNNIFTTGISDENLKLLFETANDIELGGEGAILQEKQVELLAAILFEISDGNSEFLQAIATDEEELKRALSATTAKQELATNPGSRFLLSLIRPFIAATTVKNIAESRTVSDPVIGGLSALGIDLTTREDANRRIATERQEILLSDIGQTIIENLRSDVDNSIQILNAELARLDDLELGVRDIDKRAKIQEAITLLENTFANIEGMGTVIAGAVNDLRQREAKQASNYLFLGNQVGQVITDSVNNIFAGIRTTLLEGVRPSTNVGELAGISLTSPNIDLRRSVKDLSPEEKLFSDRRDEVFAINTLKSGVDGIFDTIIQLQSSFVNAVAEGQPTQVTDAIKQQIESLSLVADRGASEIRRLGDALSQSLQVQNVVSSLQDIRREFDLLESTGFGFDRSSIDEALATQLPQILETSRGLKLGDAGLSGLEQEIEALRARGNITGTEKEQLKLREQLVDIEKRQNKERSKLEREVGFGERIREVLVDAIGNGVEGARGALARVDSQLEQAGDIVSTDDGVAKFRGFDVDSQLARQIKTFENRLKAQDIDANAVAIASELSKALGQIEQESNELIERSIQSIIDNDRDLFQNQNSILLDILQALGAGPEIVDAAIERNAKAFEDTSERASSETTGSLDSVRKAVESTGSAFSTGVIPGIIDSISRTHNLSTLDPNQPLPPNRLGRSLAEDVFKSATIPTGVFEPTQRTVQTFIPENERTKNQRVSVDDGSISSFAGEPSSASLVRVLPQFVGGLSAIDRTSKTIQRGKFMSFLLSLVDGSLKFSKIKLFSTAIEKAILPFTALSAAADFGITASANNTSFTEGVIDALLGRRIQAKSSSPALEALLESQGLSLPEGSDGEQIGDFARFGNVLSSFGRGAVVGGALTSVTGPGALGGAAIGGSIFAGVSLIRELTELFSGERGVFGDFFNSIFQPATDLLLDTANDIERLKTRKKILSLPGNESTDAELKSIDELIALKTELFELLRDDLSETANTRIYEINERIRQIRDESLKAQGASPETIASLQNVGFVEGILGAIEGNVGTERKGRADVFKIDRAVFARDVTRSTQEILQSVGDFFEPAVDFFSVSAEQFARAFDSFQIRFDLADVFSELEKAAIDSEDLFDSSGQFIGSETSEAKRRVKEAIGLALQNSSAADADAIQEFFKDQAVFDRLVAGFIDVAGENAGKPISDFNIGFQEKFLPGKLLNNSKIARTVLGDNIKDGDTDILGSLTSAVASAVFKRDNPVRDTRGVAPIQRGPDEIFDDAITGLRNFNAVLETINVAGANVFDFVGLTDSQFNDIQFVQKFKEISESLLEGDPGNADKLLALVKKGENDNRPREELRSELATRLFNGVETLNQVAQSGQTELTRLSNIVEEIAKPEDIFGVTTITDLVEILRATSAAGTPEEQQILDSFIPNLVSELEALGIKEVDGLSLTDLLTNASGDLVDTLSFEDVFEAVAGAEQGTSTLAKLLFDIQNGAEESATSLGTLIKVLASAPSQVRTFIETVKNEDGTTSSVIRSERTGSPIDDLVDGLKEFREQQLRQSSAKVIIDTASRGPLNSEEVSGLRRGTSESFFKTNEKTGKIEPNGSFSVVSGPVILQTTVDRLEKLLRPLTLDRSLSGDFGGGLRDNETVQRFLGRTNQIGVEALRNLAEGDLLDSSTLSAEQALLNSLGGRTFAGVTGNAAIDNAQRNALLGLGPNGSIDPEAVKTIGVFAAGTTGRRSPRSANEFTIEAIKAAGLTDLFEQQGITFRDVRGEQKAFFGDREVDLSESDAAAEILKRERPFYAEQVLNDRDAMKRAEESAEELRRNRRGGTTETEKTLPILEVSSIKVTTEITTPLIKAGEVEGPIKGSKSGTGGDSSLSSASANDELVKRVAQSIIKEMGQETLVEDVQEVKRDIAKHKEEVVAVRENDRREIRITKERVGNLEVKYLGVTERLDKHKDAIDTLQSSPRT